MGTSQTRRHDPAQSDRFRSEAQLCWRANVLVTGQIWSLERNGIYLLLPVGGRARR